MSPINRLKLNKLRKKLDILDNGLLNIIKKRSKIVNDVLKLKNHRNEIIDKKRINFILKKIKKRSVEKKNRYKNYQSYLEQYDLVFYRLRKEKF